MVTSVAATDKPGVSKGGSRSSKWAREALELAVVAAVRC
jgi:hypothetical protein